MSQIATKWPHLSRSSTRTLLKIVYGETQNKFHENLMGRFQSRLETLRPVHRIKSSNYTLPSQSLISKIQTCFVKSKKKKLDKVSFVLGALPKHEKN